MIDKDRWIREARDPFPEKELSKLKMEESLIKCKDKSKIWCKIQTTGQMDKVLQDKWALVHKVTKLQEIKFLRDKL